MSKFSKKGACTYFKINPPQHSSDMKTVNTKKNLKKGTAKWRRRSGSISSERWNILLINAKKES